MATLTVAKTKVCGKKLLEGVRLEVGFLDDWIVGLLDFWMLGFLEVLRLEVGFLDTWILGFLEVLDWMLKGFKLILILNF